MMSSLNQLSWNLNQYNQSDQRSNLSIQFQQNLNHNDRNISRKSGTATQADGQIDKVWRSHSLPDSDDKTYLSVTDEFGMTSKDWQNLKYATNSNELFQRRTGIWVIGKICYLFV